MKLYYMKEELPAATTLSETTIDEEIRQERFPKPRLVDGKKQWHRNDLVDWAISRPVLEPDESETELYRHFDARGRLLYVGISLSAVHRLSQHKRLAPWVSQIASITIERFQTRVEALEAESRAIIKEKPLHNIAGAKRKC